MLVETKSYLVDIDCNKGKYWAINNADQIDRVLDHLKNCKDEVLGKLFSLFRSDTTGGEHLKAGLQILIVTRVFRNPESEK